MTAYMLVCLGSGVAGHQAAEVRGPPAEPWYLQQGPGEEGVLAAEEGQACKAFRTIILCIYTYIYIYLFIYL